MKKYYYAMAALLAAPLIVAQEASRVAIPVPPDFANQSRDNSTTTFGPGEYQIGTDITRIGSGAVIRGAGMEASRLVASYGGHSANGCDWEGNNALIEDICFESRGTKGQQAQVIGWQNNYSTVPGAPQAKTGTTLKLNRFWGLGRTFTLYAWSSRGSTPQPNTVIATSSRFESGQFAVMAGGGSGPDAQYFDLYNCEIIVDFDRLVGAGGDQGLNACGVAAQGGRVRVFGGSIRVKSSKDAERAVGVWATKFPATPPASKPNWPYAFPLIELHDVDCKVDANGCTGPVFDVIGDVGTVPIKVFGGNGSGPGGKWLTSGSVMVQP